MIGRVVHESSLCSTQTLFDDHFESTRMAPIADWEEDLNWESRISFRINQLSVRVKEEHNGYFSRVEIVWVSWSQVFMQQLTRIGF